jgi:hypothetical protein
LIAPLSDSIEEAVYSDLAAAKAALRGNGYANSVEFLTERCAFYKCSTGGKYNAKCKDPSVHSLIQRPNTGTMKTYCLSPRPLWHFLGEEHH